MRNHSCLVILLISACLAGGIAADGARAAGEAGPANARLQRVMARLRRGETIRVAYMGGSITTGYAASPPSSAGYAGRVDRWWQAKAKAHKGQVVYYNMGVSGTDSAAGACRVKSHILGNEIDLVVLEFAINDQWLDPTIRKEAYEGAIRQILNAPGDIALMLLFLCQKGDPRQGQQAEQEPIGRHYGLPTISFPDSFQRDVEQGLVTWDDAFDEPIHPNSNGHRIIAGYITQYLDEVWNSLPPDEDLPAVPPVPAPLYSDDYEFTRDYGNQDLAPLTMRGWEPGSDIHPEWIGRGGAKRGWTTTAEDALLEFKLTGRIIGVFYAESDQYRNLEAWVDDASERPVELPCYVSYRTGYLGWAYRLIAKDLPPGEHVLHIRMKKDQFQGSGRQANVVSIMTAGVR